MNSFAEYLKTKSINETISRDEVMKRLIDDAKAKALKKLEDGQFAEAGTDAEKEARRKEAEKEAEESIKNMDPAELDKLVNSERDKMQAEKEKEEAKQELEKAKAEKEVEKTKQEAEKIKKETEQIKNSDDTRTQEQKDADKAVEEAKKKVDEAQKALDDNTDESKKEELQKALDDAKKVQEEAEKKKTEVDDAAKKATSEPKKEPKEEPKKDPKKDAKKDPENDPEVKKIAKQLEDAKKKQEKSKDNSKDGDLLDKVNKAADKSPTFKLMRDLAGPVIGIAMICCPAAAIGLGLGAMMIGAIKMLHKTDQEDEISKLEKAYNDAVEKAKSNNNDKEPEEVTKVNDVLKSAFQAKSEEDVDKVVAKSNNEELTKALEVVNNTPEEEVKAISNQVATAVKNNIDPIKAAEDEKAAFDKWETAFNELADAQTAYDEAVKSGKDEKELKDLRSKLFAASKAEEETGKAWEEASNTLKTANDEDDEGVEDTEGLEDDPGDDSVDPRKIYRQRPKKNGEGKTKSYYDKKGNSISQEEMQERIKRYEEKQKKNENKYTRLTNYLYEKLA